MHVQASLSHPRLPVACGSDCRRRSHYVRERPGGQRTASLSVRARLPRGLHADAGRQSHPLRRALHGPDQRLNPTTGTSTPFFKVSNVATGGEYGLLGLALSPSYPATVACGRSSLAKCRGRQRTSSCASVPTAAASLSCAASRPPSNTTAVASCSAPTASSTSSSGTTTARALAQDLASPAGKILRLNRTARCPPTTHARAARSSPTASATRSGSPSILRLGGLWETENGPECNDEINLVPRLKLNNFGWGPSATCSSPPPAPRNTNQDGPSPVLPKLFFAGRWG